MESQENDQRTMNVFDQESFTRSFSRFVSSKILEDNANHIDRVRPVRLVCVKTLH